jgi:hypothetical protein
VIVKDTIKTKTFWSGLGLIAYGIVQITNGNQTEGINSVLTGLSIIFLRDAITKTNSE